MARLPRSRRGIPRKPRVALTTRGRTRKRTVTRGIRPRRRRHTRGGGGGSLTY